jgi:O-antigen ligase
MQSMAHGKIRPADLQLQREVVFRKATFFFLWILLFVIPWENAVVIDGFGTISRVVGIPAFGMALLAILECGTLRMLAPQQIIMLVFLIWGGFTYFWTFSATATVTSIYTFVQLFMLVWLIWEFAQSRKQQLLLLRAYMLGSIVSSVGMLLDFFHNTGLQSGGDSGLGFNPGDLAFTLALAIPMSLYLAAHERRNILVWVDGSAAILASCAMVLTASRVLILACIPAVLMFPFLFPKLRLRRNLVALVLVALAGIGSWLFVPESSWSRQPAIGTEITSGKLNKTTMISQIGWQLFRHAPFQGVGVGAYAPAVEHTLGSASAVSAMDTDWQAARLAAHNTFFSILVEQGISGFGLFVALLVVLVLSAWELTKIDRLFWLCILMTWAIGALDMPWDQRKPTWFIFGLLISVAATKPLAEARSSPTQGPRSQGPEVHGEARLSTEISISQGLS